MASKGVSRHGVSSRAISSRPPHGLQARRTDAVHDRSHESFPRAPAYRHRLWRPHSPRCRSQRHPSPPPPALMSPPSGHRSRWSARARRAPTRASTVPAAVASWSRGPSTGSPLTRPSSASFATMAPPMAAAACAPTTPDCSATGPTRASAMSPTARCAPTAPAGFVFEGRFKITGGLGRFDGARGRGDVTVTIGADGSATLGATGSLRLPR